MSKLVFNISTGAAYPAMESSFKHGYGGNLRYIGANVYSALQTGELSVERLRGFFFLAQRNGNPNADASALLKKKGELENAEVKKLKSNPTPTDADIQAENERKAAEAAAQSGAADGEGTEKTVVEGESFPLDIVMQKFADAKGDMAKMKMDELVVIAESLGVDTSGCKSKTDLNARIQEVLDEVQNQGAESRE